MPRLPLVLCLALAACYHPPGSGSGAGGTTGSGDTGTTSGAATGSTGGTSGTAGSTGSGTGSGGATSGAGSSSGGGTTGVALCDPDLPCPAGSACALQVQHCPSPGGWAELSLGGSCVGYHDCPGGSCVGRPCASDNDCGLYERCGAQGCEGLLCPLGVAFCDPGCTLIGRPHDCQSDCICSTCPGDADAGPGPGCDLDRPCPAGSTCAFRSQPCPGAGGPALSLGGTCEGYRDCDGGCYGQPCTRDDDCGQWELCGQDGTCGSVACPDFWPGPCPDGCQYVDPPHSCVTQCLCPVCPSVDAGAPCDPSHPCGSGLGCDESFAACAEPGIYVAGPGQCVPDCGNGGPCPAACASDWDCPAYSTCQGGSCQAYGCPPSLLTCPTDCPLINPPHGCPRCACEVCPTELDGGSGPACDSAHPCPAGSGCDEQLAGCADPALYVELGGQCRPDCGSGGPCLPPGQPCASDWQCPAGEGCYQGSCTAFPCAMPQCPPGSTLTARPHGCPYCATPGCPGADGGPGPGPGGDGGPDADAGFCSQVDCAFDCCTDRCTYLQTDTENCGSCGHACGPGQFCSGGACQDSADGGPSGCDADGGAGVACGDWGGLCCPTDQLCCYVSGPVGHFECSDPAAGCQIGCPMCL